MNDLPRQKLAELIGRFGLDRCNDPKQCEGLLNDVCRGEYKREIAALVNAARTGVGKELQQVSAGMPKKLVIARLTKRLCDDFGHAEDLARWAIESWALALRVITPSDIERSPPPISSSVSYQPDSYEPDDGDYDGDYDDGYDDEPDSYPQYQPVSPQPAPPQPVLPQPTPAKPASSGSGGWGCFAIGIGAFLLLSNLYSSWQNDSAFAWRYKNLTVTGYYQPFEGGIFWDTQRGMNLTLDGVRTTIPKCKVNITFRKGSQSKGWQWDVDNWKRGEKKSFNTRKGELTFDPDNIDICISFPGTNYTHQQTWKVK